MEVADAVPMAGEGDTVVSHALGLEIRPASKNGVPVLHSHLMK